MKDFFAHIRARIKAWEYFRQGKITFKEALLSMVPTRFRSSYATTFFDKPFIISDGNVMVFLALKSEIITSNQYRVELVKDHAIDAGANVGVFSIYASIKHPDATIYAFEPNPSTFKALQENTKYYSNIKVFNCGLGEKNAMASLIPTNYSVMSRIGEGGIPVEMKTVDSFGIPADFIKMDTEGYEANILRGAAETIKKHKPIIVMSAYHNPDDKTELPALLNTITPYDCELRHDEEEDLVCRPVSA
jgi:FkbM family methyltransferase